MLMTQYLQDLECPVPYEADAVHSLLDWLLHHAVSLEYQDAGALHNTVETSCNCSRAAGPELVDMSKPSLISVAHSL